MVRALLLPFVGIILFLVSCTPIPPEEITPAKTDLLELRVGEETLVNDPFMLHIKLQEVGSVPEFIESGRMDNYEPTPVDETCTKIDCSQEHYYIFQVDNLNLTRCEQKEIVAYTLYPAYYRCPEFFTFTLDLDQSTAEKAVFSVNFIGITPIE